jgi:cytochrome c-type biogenesis protein CcmH/NrfG
MKPESIVVGIAGALFGLLCGWMLGAQQAAPVAGPAAPVAQSAPAAGGGQTAQTQGGSSATPVDVRRAQELEAQAQQNPRDAAPRTQLGNMYFDAEKYADAVKWYEASLAIAPNNADVSTDLAVSYYYSNQTDKALAQFQKSLAVDPRHTKTLLNLGIVRAFGKQDLTGAAEAWKQVVQLAPADSPEARAARQALEGLKAAHPEITGDAPAGGAPAPAPAPKQGA